jgi:NitT/TauT family transport system substrate-binding protein
VSRDVQNGKAAEGRTTGKGSCMQGRARWFIAGFAALAALAATGVVAAAPTGAKADKITLQLKWVTQAQFAGYYAAAAKGYYKAANLDVTIKPGGPDITPEQVVASGQAQFGLDWVPSLLSARDKGGNLVDIGQVFQRSGMTELTWKDSGISTIAQMKGKKVGNWLFGNEFELFAALVKNGIDPHKTSQVKIVQQPFDMNLFLQRKIDAASAMTYNELAQVLETKNPKTGKLFQLSDLNVIKMQDVGTGMLEDDIFSTESYLKDKAHQDIAKRFLEASFKGWIWCRDHFQDCVNIVLQNGPTLGKGHQVWQMNEINALVWPSPQGIGVMNAAAFNRTAKIAQEFKVITKAPKGAWRSDLAKAAVADLKKEGVDVTGANWKKATVQVTAGGK